MCAEGPESKSGAEDEWDGPAPALVVDVLQALLDEPVDIRQSTQVAEPELGPHLKGTNADEHAACRTKGERPGLLEELSVLSCESGRRRGRHTHEGTPD